ncbi:class I SAM-dependent methyltransferase [Nocardia sp. NBC_01327]|uniref:class I SAM-dependent methyltransferase n=1 Tax=Nocardia sp. NBC_01327 TaxID=2903593 RepID=UPI002E0E9EC6|nr:class I SAM-dependent methyltransferase [Nocardia sp. NBC_01327]
MGDLFRGTAWHYARYRPGYPREFVDEIIRTFDLDGSGRILDLGCGTGQLTVPLAMSAGEAVGVDPESEMLIEAAAYAASAGVTNAIWVEGSSAKLPTDLGRFEVVTMGRSFHWMEREQVLAVLDKLVKEAGGLVIANDSCLVRPVTDWQQRIEEIQNRFVPTNEQRRPRFSDDYLPHEEILRRSAFPKVDRRVYEFQREWTVAQAIGYLYSTSMPLRRLLSDRDAFEREITHALTPLAADGRLFEPVSLEVFIATRR